MTTKKLNPQVLNEIDELYDIYMRTRSFFPRLSKKSIGTTGGRTAPFYWKRGYDVTVTFSKPIDDELLNTYRELGRWINQSAVIRLCAMLEYHKFIPTKKGERIDPSIEFSKEIELLREMRNVFSHTSGKLRKLNERDQEVADKVKKHFNIKEEYPGEVPTPIDAVVIPLVDAARKYAKAKLRI